MAKKTNPHFQFSPKTKIVDQSTIYLMNQEGIDSIEHYIEIFEYLRSKEIGDEIRLVLSGPGGHLNTAIAFMNEIANSPAIVVAEILGSVASGHSMIALACDAIITHPGSSVMLHTFTGGNYGKGRDAEVSSQHTNKQMEEVFLEHIQGFMTETEIQDMLEINRDLYFTGQELRDRILKLYKFRNDNGMNKQGLVIEENNIDEQT
jgi:ATP-dependent protease ClpP protease subunit